MKRTTTRFMVAATFFLLIFGTAQNTCPQEVNLTPEMVMTKFLQAFVARDYETCRFLLAPGATITITRRYQQGTYQSQHQDARDWLDEVDAGAVKGIKDFKVDILETAGLVHAHGATAVLRFTSTGMTGRGKFENTGFDTGSLIETADGWRILHYSSFEHFSWSGATP